MADNQEEEVVYSYVGDTSSLKQATQDAISLLGKFDNAIKAAASTNAFSASKTSATGFQRTLNGLVKQVNSLTASVNTAGANLATGIPNGAAVVQSASRDLADVLEYLDTSTSITSADMKFLTEVLKSTGASLESVVSRAHVLSTSMKSLETLNADSELATTSQAAQSVEKHFKAAAASGFRVQEAYKASGKSAAESAAVFLRAARSGEKMNNVQSIIRRVQIEFNLLGTKARQAWDKFANRIDPTGVKLQSFKDKANKALNSVRKATAQVTSAFRRTSETVDDSSEAASAASSKMAALSSALSKLSSRTAKSNSIFDTLTKTLKSLSRMAVRLVAVRLGQWLAEAAKQSISYAENVNLFTVAMGDSLDVGTEFINQMSEIYGMDPSNLMRYAGNFYQLADAIEMPSASAANLSLGLVKATNDISSLFNVPIEDVFEDLSSGMQGMSRAVRKYGMDIRTTTLQQTALSLGITESVENMSEANRQGLRFITMMRQASNASGDFARTIESPANQLKIFKEQITQLGRAIGDLFITPLSSALQYINGFVMALRTVISFIGSVLGMTNKVSTDSVEDLAGSVDAIGGAAKSAAKELKKMIAPFDELNVLQQAETSGGALSDVGNLDPSIEDAIANMSWSLDDVKMKAIEVRDALLSFFGFKIDTGEILSWDASAFEANLIEKFPQWTQTIQAVFDNWSSIVNSFKDVVRALGDVAEAAWAKVAGLFGDSIDDDSIAKFIEKLSKRLTTFAKFLTKNQDSIANFAIAVGAIGAAFKGFAAIQSVAVPVAQFVSTCSTALVPLASVLGWVVAIAAAIGVLYVSSESFAGSFRNLFTEVTGGLLLVFEAFINSLQLIWAGSQVLWTENIQPMFAGLGDALAPVIDTIISLWNNLIVIIVDVFGIIDRVWTSTLQPVLALFFDAITKLAEVFENLWNECLGPVLEYIGDGIERLWTDVLSPVAEKIIEVVGGIIEVILLLWNNVLAPVLNWLIQSLGPSITSFIENVWDAVEAVVGSIGKAIEGLLEIFKGIIDFIAGVFSGDWERAWKGVVNIFVGIGNLLIGIFETVVNLIIGLINSMVSLIWNGVTGLINIILGAVEGVADLVGYDLDIKISSEPPQIPTLSIPRIPEMATGGVVTSPTLSWIGEGRYDEAVIPLGNSPQMQDLVNQIAEATKNKGGGADTVHVHVYVGNEQIAEYMQRADRRAQLQTNGGI